MGRGDACPHAAESSRLGWSSSAATIDASRLTIPGAVQSFVLPASYITGFANHLKVIPNWLPTYGNNTVSRNLYIDVRVAKGADASLSSGYANRVNVHEVNATMVGGCAHCSGT
jgi:hypothetical protein